jgi:hypothetical protein
VVDNTSDMQEGLTVQAYTAAVAAVGRWKTLTLFSVILTAVRLPYHQTPMARYERRTIPAAERTGMLRSGGPDPWILSSD